MDFIVEENRIFLEDDEKIIAEVLYRKVDDETYDIYKTYVSESLRGQGIASKLVEKAVTELEKKGYRVIGSCSYAKKWLESRK